MPPRYRTADGAVSAEVDGVTVVLSPSMEYVQLDSTGSEIWRALASHDTAEAVADALTSIFDVPADVLAADVEIFMEHLVASGLAVRVE